MTPDDPARDAAARPCAAREGYGTHPRAHPAVGAFAARVAALLDEVAEDQLPERVAEALGGLLSTPDLLCAELRQGSSEHYCKHVLHADEEGRFTLLALVWQPGQTTDIHGHTAWGAVGVYEGRPGVACYECSERSGGGHRATLTKDVPCAPGDTATVRPGLCDTHRIYNDSDTPVITLHAYGLDLVRDPDAINIHLDLGT